MRWRQEHHHYGATRHRKRFLLWPKKINGETRWLEMGYWWEEWTRGSAHSACNDFWQVTHWANH